VDTVAPAVPVLYAGHLLLDEGEQTMKKVYVVTSHHGAEGTEVIAVFKTEPTGAQAQAIARERSTYDSLEWDAWCQGSVEEHEVEEVPE
jgi:hypothetical protein